MNTLPQFLLRLVNSNRYGGQTICRDENTVVLYDCGGGDHAEQREPLRVQTGDGCLFGFVHAVKEQRHLSAYWRLPLARFLHDRYIVKLELVCFDFLIWRAYFLIFVCKFGNPLSPVRHADTCSVWILLPLFR